MRTLVRMLLMSIVGFGFCTPVRSADAPPVQLDVVGLSITAPIGNEEGARQLLFGREPGVDVVLRLSVPDSMIIGFQADKQKPPRLEDDRGKVLGDASDDPFFNMHSVYSRDGHRCWWTLHAKRTPPSDATRLRVRGNLVLVCGTNKKTVSAKTAFRVGEHFQLGPVSVRIARVGPPKSLNLIPLGGTVGGTRTPAAASGIRLVMKQYEFLFQPRATIKFFTADGRPIPARWQSSGTGGVMPGIPTTKAAGSTGDGGSKQPASQPEYFYEFGLNAAPPEIQVRAEVFEKIRRTAVPIDVSFGLSLDAPGKLQEPKR